LHNLHRFWCRQVKLSRIWQSLISLKHHGSNPASRSAFGSYSRCSASFWSWVPCFLIYGVSICGCLWGSDGWSHQLLFVGIISTSLEDAHGVPCLLPRKLVFNWDTFLFLACHWVVGTCFNFNPGGDLPMQMVWIILGSQFCMWLLVTLVVMLYLVSGLRSTLFLFLLLFWYSWLWFVETFLLFHYCFSFIAQCFNILGVLHFSACVRFFWWLELYSNIIGIVGLIDVFLWCFDLLPLSQIISCVLGFLDILVSLCN